MARLSASQLANARIVASIARMYGVDPVLAVATAYHESGLRNSATGDNGSSFGLFQLHRGGMLGSHSSAWARDPRNNARTAISSLAQYQRRGGYGSPGALAAASQRPAAPGAYASAVNSSLSIARQILRSSGRGSTAAAVASGARSGGRSTPPRGVQPTVTTNTFQPISLPQMPPITIRPATDVFAGLQPAADAAAPSLLAPRTAPPAAGPSAYDDLDAIRRQLLRGYGV